MATDKQIAANRANASKSTGPKTDAGRAAVRLNAVRHGLTAETIVLQDEDQAQFEETRAAFEAEYNPDGPTENLLVQQIVVAAWRLRRARAMSTGHLERGLMDITDPSFAARLSYVASNHIHMLDYLARYETRIERSFYRALHELQRVQAARVARTVRPPVSPEPVPAKQTQSGRRPRGDSTAPAPLTRLNSTPPAATPAQPVVEWGSSSEAGPK